MTMQIRRPVANAPVSTLIRLLMYNGSRLISLQTTSDATQYHFGNGETQSAKDSSAR
jgi:hypothetical protein